MCYAFFSFFSVGLVLLSPVLSSFDIFVFPMWLVARTVVIVYLNRWYIVSKRDSKTASRATKEKLKSS